MTYVNNINRKTHTTSTAFLFLLGALLLSSCSTTHPNDDPLKYSRKLIKQGHTSLYNNGAFKVPFTEIKLIPAGKSAKDTALELMGFHARQSLLQSLQNAAESIYIVPAGTKLSLKYAKNIQRGGKQLATGVSDFTRAKGTMLIDRSIAAGKDITVKSWQFGKKTATAMSKYGIAIEEGAIKTGDAISHHMTNEGKEAIRQSWTLTKKISDKSNTSAKRSLLYASNEFIKGYVAVPKKLSHRAKQIADASDLDNFVGGITNANRHRKKYSKYMTDIVTNTAGEYVENVKGSLNKASNSFSDSVGVTGFGLAFLKSTRWVLQGILWDGLVKPVSKIGAASVGYMAVNLAAFPTLVIINEGIAITNLAIEFSWNTVGSSYDLVAPSAKAAVASIYSLLQFTVGNTVAGGSGAGVAAFGAGSIVTGQLVGKTVKGVGYIFGKSVQYIGVPVTAAGVTLGSGTVGVVAGSAGVITGSAVLVGGEAASLTSNVFGNVLAGTTLAAGTAGSVVVATGVGIYELSKAIVVPVTYELGGGIVLGYASASQLAAHSVLAAADAAYLVLSLEGPRWVVYAVTGKLGNGDSLPPGTLLDLEAMQDKGEEFHYLPVSDKEMNSVVEQVYQELPASPDVPVLVETETE